MFVVQFAGLRLVAFPLAAFYLDLDLKHFFFLICGSLSRRGEVFLCYRDRSSDCNPTFAL